VKGVAAGQELSILLERPLLNDLQPNALGALAELLLEVSLLNCAAH
jgi:hypothetical protein